MYQDFEWDGAKALDNVQKHGVSFEEAVTAFLDPGSLVVFDRQHSDDEDRFVHFGLSANGRLLAIVYTERGARVRVISARNATPTEGRQYEQHNR